MFKGLAEIAGYENKVHCTEFQLLNDFYLKRDQILGSDNDYFLMYMWTEKAPCRSCTKVIYEFLDYFKSGKLQIYHDWNDRLSNARRKWLLLGDRVALQKKKFKKFG